MGNNIRSVIPVSEYPSRGGYKVEIRASLNGGRRLRKFFTTKFAAERFRDEFAGRMLEVGVQSATIGGELVSSAIDQFVSEKLRNASLRESQTLRLNKARISTAFGHVPLELLSEPRGAKMVADWLNRQEWSKRTRFNAFSYLRTFLRWCHRRGMIKQNCADRLADEISKPPSPKEIVTPEEMKILLHVTKRDPVMRAFVVFAGFAGVRTDEIRKIDWMNCDWDGQEIHIPPDAIKKTEGRGGMRERYVKMIPAFLRHIPKGLRGKVIPMSTPKAFYERRAKLLPRIRKIAARIRLQNSDRWASWPDNCLRHTFASAMLADSRDAWAVAHELGHENTKTIHKDYARAMRANDAKRYLSL